MKPQIIIALDFKSKEEALAFVGQFTDPAYFKIGMELFYAAGPDVVREVKARGHKVFLDLKLHDIPNTVKSAMRVLGTLGVDMTNVHAAGGRRMMAAALEGLTEGAAVRAEQTGEPATRPLLIAVTQLTSTDQAMLGEELCISGDMKDVVAHYARNAAAAGLDGVVCSAWEAGDIHGQVDPGFLTVTPGIRLAGDAADDQSRIATPARAVALGADYLVIGRSITRADDPVAAYQRCLREMDE